MDIKIFQKPQVKLVGHTELDGDGIYKFLKEHEMGWPHDSESPLEMISEFGGRLCYMSFGKGRKTSQEYHGHIIEVGHGSVFEHGVWNFAIYNVSRSLTHELVRHKAGTGISQLSQRYVDESVAEYVIPPLFNKPELMDEYKNDIATIHEIYLKWADKAGRIIDQYHPHLQGTDKRKNARQAARYFLPNATETKLLFTANTRALRNVIAQRASKAADVEIRALGVALFKLAAEEAPALFQDAKLIQLPEDGTEAVEFAHPKV